MPNDSIVQVNVPWFMTLNMALVIFTAAFVVHVNCFWNSLLFFFKNPHRLIRYPFIIQTGVAVACHSCRLTDYFFITNCDFKGYYNYIHYYTAIFVLNLLGIWRIYVYMTSDYKGKYTNCINSKNKIKNHQFKLKQGFSGIVIAILLIFVGFQILTQTLALKNGFSSAFGDLAFCISGPDSLGLLLLTIGESFFHVALLFTLLIILSSRYINLPKEKRNIKYLKSNSVTSVLNEMGLDFGIFYLIMADLLVICFFGILQINDIGTLTPEIFVQLKWATQTKCYNEMFTYIDNNKQIYESKDNFTLTKCVEVRVYTGDDSEETVGALISKENHKF